MHAATLGTVYNMHSHGDKKYENVLQLAPTAVELISLNIISSCIRIMHQAGHSKKNNVYK